MLRFVLEQGPVIGYSGGTVIIGIGQLQGLEIFYNQRPFMGLEHQPPVFVFDRMLATAFCNGQLRLPANPLHIPGYGAGGSVGFNFIYQTVLVKNMGMGYGGWLIISVAMVPVTYSRQQ